MRDYVERFELEEVKELAADTYATRAQMVEVRGALDSKAELLALLRVEAAGEANKELYANLKTDVDALQALLQSTRQDHDSSLEHLAKALGDDKDAARRAVRQLHSEIESLEQLLATSNAAHNQRQAELEHKISGCCTIQAMDGLYQSMREFAKTAELQELRDEVRPRLEEWDAKVSECVGDNEDVRVCVRQFDATLCQKVNKSHLAAMEASIDSTFMKRKDLEGLIKRIEDRAANREDEARKLVGTWETHEAATKERFFEYSGQVLEQKLEQYEAVKNSFAPFFNAESLRSTLAGKVNTTDFEKMSGAIASKASLAEARMALHTLNDRLKHVSIVQSELAKSLLPSKPSGSINATE